MDYVTDKIKRVVAGCIERKEWRSSAEEAATAYLPRKSPRAAYAAVKDYVKAEYDAAGAGFSGRWQG